MEGNPLVSMYISDVFFLTHYLDQKGICIHLVLKLQMPTFLALIYFKHNIKEIIVICDADL